MKMQKQSKEKELLQGNIIKKKLKAPLKKAERNITQKLHKAGKK